MNEFTKFLDTNINKIGSYQLSEIYRVGVAEAHFLDAFPFLALNQLDQIRFLYVKNLCLNDPVAIDIRSIEGLITPEEMALIYLSFNDFEMASSSLNLPLRLEIIGAKAKTRTGQTRIVDILSTDKTSSCEQMMFETTSLSFDDFLIQPLNKTELLLIYIRMMEIYKKEENADLRKFKLNAYLRRALHESNDLTGSLRIAFLLVNAEITNEYEELEKYVDFQSEISERLFTEPMIFKSDVYIQIARSLIATFDFGAAFKYLEPFPLFYEKIECLIAMKKSDVAANEIFKYIDLIKDTDSKRNKITLSELYIKLGHIYQDPSYYDIAASLFRSHKPYMLKGMHFYRNKQFENAVEALELAVRISPNNEDVLFSYGCSLFETERVAEAMKIFRRLRAENPLNLNIVKNLSMCYYKLRDIENTLETIKSVALQDPSAMKQYIFISLRNEKLDNVKWALQHTMKDPIIKEVVNYLIQGEKMSRDELKSILSINLHFKGDVLDEIFI